MSILLKKVFAHQLVPHEQKSPLLKKKKKEESKQPDSAKVDGSNISSLVLANAYFKFDPENMNENLHLKNDNTTCYT